MSKSSGGKYWDEGWQLVDGCTHVSEGCDYCWSAAMSARFPRCKDLTIKGRFHGGIVFNEHLLERPLRRRKPTRYSVWNDLFHKSVQDAEIDRVLAVAARCPQHTFLLLTKRPERMKAYFHSPDMGTNLVRQAWPAPNVWLGVTVENQKRADERIPLLLQTPAAVRFVSYEPALGPVDFRARGYLGYNEWTERGDIKRLGLDWLIAGGETGPSARPAHPDWFRRVRDDCAAAGVPFFFKGGGEWLSSEDVPSEIADTYSSKTRGSRQPSALVENELFVRVGKKYTGNKLDGKQYKEFPEGKGDG